MGRSIVRKEDHLSSLNHSAISGDYSFRGMQASDLPLVIRIERNAYEFPWSFKTFQDCLRAGYLCHVMIKDCRLVGYGVMAIGVEQCHILNLCIDAQVQCHGYGRRLLNHFMHLARGYDSKEAFLEMRASNSAANHLYMKAGFVEIETRRGYYPARRGREDALVLVKSLREA